mmetsp:Transcript_48540/g.125941  ORF Transcript_48540/g.125941 Transcript_48540/m.125941 type:complete len:102 (+) Transcript_48540:260-565(+)
MEKIPNTDTAKKLNRQAKNQKKLKRAPFFNHRSDENPVKYKSRISSHSSRLHSMKTQTNTQSHTRKNRTTKQLNPYKNRGETELETRKRGRKKHYYYCCCC